VLLEKKNTKTILHRILICPLTWVKSILLPYLQAKIFQGLSKKSIILTMLVLLIITAILVCATFYNNKGMCTLTSAEEKIIDKYIKECPIEDSIGQILMVGIPADYKNYKDAKNLDIIFTDMGIGAAIINGYNYFNPNKYDDVTYLNSVIEFNNAMQGKAQKSKLALPLLLATDFESSSFTSIKSALTLPPSALAIGVSQNPLYANLVGKLTGLQLKNIGCHIILGPVLDSYNIKQGNRSTLRDRCFASTPKGVVAIGSHFIKGLKEGGVSAFAKHFPSYGSVEENPHTFAIPVYEGAAEQLMGEIKPFLYFKDSIDGIMTSHILLTRINNELATFSNTFISEHLRSLGFNDQLIITDDLSNMGAINKYSQTSKEDFKDIAIKAFAAGHDILLFSHFAEIDKRSSFSIVNLKEVRNGLIDYIKTSNSEKQFRQSFKRVILQKAKFAKSMGYSVDKFLIERAKVPFFHIHHDGHEVMGKSQGFLKSYDENINTGDKLIKEIICNAATVINEKISYKLKSYPSNAKILFFTYAEGAKYLKQSIAPLNKNAEFIIVPKLKNGDVFKKVRKKLIENFDKADLIFYTVFDKSDSDLLSYVQKQKKTFSNKVVILCHSNPVIFDNLILSQATVVSTFTNHPFSYDVDLDILSNKYQPKKLKNLPISVGENGGIYNVANTTFVEPTDLASYEQLFPKYLVDERTLKILKDNNFVISKVQVKKSLFIIINIILIFILIVAIFKTYRDLSVKIKEKDLFVTLGQLLTTAFITNPSLILPMVSILIINIIFFRGETLNVYNLGKNLIDKLF